MRVPARRVQLAVQLRLSLPCVPLCIFDLHVLHTLTSLDVGTNSRCGALATCGCCWLPTFRQPAVCCTVGPHCISAHFKTNTLLMYLVCAGHHVASSSGNNPAASVFNSAPPQLPRRPYFPSALHSGESASDQVNESAGPDSKCGGRRKRGSPDEDCDFELLADPEERKLEKRRAKNRRTARISRERKQAEVVQLKAELDSRAAEVARLYEIIQMKDQQIRAMACMPSTSRGGMQVGGDMSVKRSTSHESAELKCGVQVAKCVQVQRHAPLLTASPPCSTICGVHSTGELVQQLQMLMQQMRAEACEVGLQGAQTLPERCIVGQCRPDEKFEDWDARLRDYKLEQVIRDCPLAVPCLSAESCA